MIEDYCSGKLDTTTKRFRIVTGTGVVINENKMMSAHAAGYLLNAFPGLAFLLSVLISCNGVLAIHGQPG